MPSDLNRVFLIGRLVRDPELRSTPSGTQVASFSVANNRTYMAGSEKKEQVSFFNCVAWGKLAELIAQYCKKGNRIGLEGRLQQRSWDDKDGNKHSTVEITADNVQFLTPKDGAFSNDSPMDAGASFQETPPNFPVDAQPFSDGDVPF